MMKPQPWRQIQNQQDIDALMQVFGGFHDSCIREMRLLGEGYVTDNFSMGKKPASLRMVMQHQFPDPSAIELEFSGLSRLNLSYCSNYFPDIFDAALFFCQEDGENVIYWANNENWTPEEESHPYDVWIRANALQWRILEDALGDTPIYTSPFGLDDEEDGQAPNVTKGPANPL